VTRRRGREKSIQYLRREKKNSALSGVSSFEGVRRTTKTVMRGKIDPKK